MKRRSRLSDDELEGHRPGHRGGIVQDGERVRCPMYMMDSVQREVRRVFGSPKRIVVDAAGRACGSRPGHAFLTDAGKKELREHVAALRGLAQNIDPDDPDNDDPDDPDDPDDEMEDGRMKALADYQRRLTDAWRGRDLQPPDTGRVRRQEPSSEPPDDDDSGDIDTTMPPDNPGGDDGEDAEALRAGQGEDAARERYIAWVSNQWAAPPPSYFSPGPDQQSDYLRRLQSNPGGPGNVGPITRQPITRQPVPAALPVTRDGLDPRQAALDARDRYLQNAWKGAA